MHRDGVRDACLDASAIGTEPSPARVSTSAWRNLGLTGHDRSASSELARQPCLELWPLSPEFEETFKLKQGTGGRMPSRPKRSKHVEVIRLSADNVNKLERNESLDAQEIHVFDEGVCVKPPHVNVYVFIH